MKPTKQSEAALPLGEIKKSRRGKSLKRVKTKDMIEKERNLSVLTEEAEETYYATNAAELNADSKSWSRITTVAAKFTFKSK